MIPNSVRGKAWKEARVQGPGTVRLRLVSWVLANGGFDKVVPSVAGAQATDCGVRQGSTPISEGGTIRSWRVAGQKSVEIAAVNLGPKPHGSYKYKARALFQVQYRVQEHCASRGVISLPYRVRRTVSNECSNPRGALRKPVRFVEGSLA